jgi:hypothetical protein
LHFKDVLVIRAVHGLEKALFPVDKSKRRCDEEPEVEVLLNPVDGNVASAEGRWGGRGRVRIGWLGVLGREGS